MAFEKKWPRLLRRRSRLEGGYEVRVMRGPNWYAFPAEVIGLGPTQEEADQAARVFLATTKDTKLRIALAKPIVIARYSPTAPNGIEVSPL